MVDQMRAVRLGPRPREAGLWARSPGPPADLAEPAGAPWRPVERTAGRFATATTPAWESPLGYRPVGAEGAIPPRNLSGTRTTTGWRSGARGTADSGPPRQRGRA